MSEKENGSSSSKEKENEDLDRGLYFVEVCGGRRGGGGGGDMEKEEEEEEEGPTELNTINSSGGFAVVSSDKLSVKYTSVNLHGHDVGVIQGNKAAPRKRLIYYFEIYVKDAGAKGQIAIGFTSDNFKMRRQPGWDPNSCGYHGDDGLLYRGHAKGEPFGPTYTSSDIVGAGINYAAHQFFFTKNGQLVGTLYKDINPPLFPTIAVHSLNEEYLSLLFSSPLLSLLLTHYSHHFSL